MHWRNVPAFMKGVKQEELHLESHESWVFKTDTLPNGLVGGE